MDFHSTRGLEKYRCLKARVYNHCPGTGKQNDVNRIAAYFPELSPAQVRKLLARSLAVSDRQLNDALAEVADELAFHIATDPAVRFGLLDVVKPIKKKGMTVKAVKNPRRMFKHASLQLKSKLT